MCALTTGVSTLKVGDESWKDVTSGKRTERCSTSAERMADGAPSTLLCFPPFTTRGPKVRDRAERPSQKFPPAEEESMLTSCTSDRRVAWWPCDGALASCLCRAGTSASGPAASALSRSLVSARRGDSSLERHMVRTWATPPVSTSVAAAGELWANRDRRGDSSSAGILRQSTSFPGVAADERTIVAWYMAASRDSSPRTGVAGEAMTRSSLQCCNGYRGAGRKAKPTRRAGTRSV
mmetsp:Transcript_44903/g.142975  ORF Transcript_44903/g.142975 Transcript_44903/m.142975 type:complete len:236 (-) Transcript_44903:92-799(-)